jgi:phage/plasmid-associated DNA primase
MNNPIFSIDSEGRVYDSANNYFAQIENATDIKLSGRKSARLFNPVKGYLGQGDQWVKDKDQAKLFTSKTELKRFLNLYFQSDDDSQSKLTYFDQFTVSNEVNSEVVETTKPNTDLPNSEKMTTIVAASPESPELENALNPKLFLVTLIASYRCFKRLLSYREKVIKEFETSGIPSDVTDCCTDIFTPDNAQELKQRFIGKILKTDGSLDDKYKSFEAYNSGGWVALNSAKNGQDNPFTIAKLTTPRIVFDHKTNKSEPIKYDAPLGIKTHKDIPYYLLPKLADKEVLKQLINGIISKHGLNLKADDYATYSDFFNAAKKLIFVNVSEGFKKAVALICQGELAFSLSSTTTWGYKDNDNNTVLDSEGFKMLNPQIKELLKDSKGLIINFDCDSKKTTIQNITNQCNQFALACHRELGITVKRRLWDNKLGKGIDDLLTNGYTLETHTQVIELDIEKLTIEIKENNEIKRQKELAYQEKNNKKQAIENKKKEIETKVKEGKTSEFIVTYKDEVIRDLFSKDKWITVEDNWYKFNGKFYEEVNPKFIKQKILNYLDNYIDSDKNGDPTKPFANNACVNECFNWIKTKFFKDIKEINPDGYLPLDNGILLVTENNGKVEIKLEPHSPDKYFTYCSEVKYDPNADLKEAYKLLECLDEPYKTLLIQSLSTILNFSLIRKKRDRIKALILEGDGSNGKDTLRSVISLILGKKGMTGCNFNDFRLADNGRAFNLKRLESKPKINWSSENRSNMSIDDLQSLKQSITGDTIYVEGKGKDGVEIELSNLFIFNANKAPDLKANQSAIQSRFTIIPLEKVYSMKPVAGQLQADPRYKHDREFLINQVAPAFLNLMLTGFEKVYYHGIDYDSASDYLNKVMLESNHLRQFCQDIGLVFTGSEHDCLTCGDLYDELEHWYELNGYCEIDRSNDKKKRTWLDGGKKSDPIIKASHQVKSRFKELFPKIQEKNIHNKRCLVGLGFKKVNSLVSLTQQGLEITPEVSNSLPIDYPEVSSGEKSTEIAVNLTAKDQANPSESNSGLNATTNLDTNLDTNLKLTYGVSSNPYEIRNTNLPTKNETNLSENNSEQQNFPSKDQIIAALKEAHNNQAKNISATSLSMCYLDSCDVMRLTSVLMELVTEGICKYDDFLESFSLINP